MAGGVESFPDSSNILLNPDHRGLLLFAVRRHETVNLITESLTSNIALTEKDTHTAHIDSPHCSFFS